MSLESYLHGYAHDRPQINDEGMRMKLTVLRRMIRVNAADAKSYRLGDSNRKCKRLSKSDIAWITKHGTEYTALEVGKLLSHTPNTIRAVARRCGVQLRQVRHYE